MLSPLRVSSQSSLLGPCSFQSAQSRMYSLVGGPLPDDSYADDCQDFEANYVSLVGNAGFTSAVAGLKQLAMRRRRA